MYKNLFTAVISILSVACSTQTTVISTQGNTDSLAGLQAMANTKVGFVKQDESGGKIREMAIKETALSIGARSGLAWRAKYIDDSLTKEARRLDTIYNFNALILDKNVLPPVLLEGRNTLNLADTQTIRVSDRTYKVAKQAKFVTTAPNWRQYLWMDYKAPENPHNSLLPKNKIEKEVWIYYAEKGWNNGIEQANTILEENIARLKEDFAGMILYRKLLAMNMVSSPFVSQTDLGITGNGDEIHIDDHVLRITALPQLNTNSGEWHAAIKKDEAELAILNKLESAALKEPIKSPISPANKDWHPVIDSP